MHTIELKRFECGSTKCRSTRLVFIESGGLNAQSRCDTQNKGTALHA